MSTDRIFSNAVRIAVGAEVYAPGAVNQWTTFLRTSGGPDVGAMLSHNVFQDHCTDWVRMYACETEREQPDRRDAQVGCPEAGWPDVGDRYWVDEGPNA